MKVGYENRELLATALLLKGLDKPLAAQINKQSRRVIKPVWQQALAEHATTRLETVALVKTASVVVKNYGVILRSAVSVKRLRGGATVDQIARAAEFGAGQNHFPLLTSSRGKKYHRHTTRQFKKSNAKGYVVYPALAEVIKRIASLWAQTTVRTFWEEVDKRGQ